MGNIFPVRRLSVFTVFLTVGSTTALSTRGIRSSMAKALFYWIYSMLAVLVRVPNVVCEGEKETAAPPGDEFVLVLTTDNFDDATAQHKHILVEFYAPWCNHCRQLAPVYAEAASLLHADGSAIKMAKVDASLEGELAKRFSVGRYPTVLFFRSGQPVQYEQIQDHSANEIVAWLNRKTGPPAEVVTSKDRLDKLHADFNVIVAGFFKNPDAKVVKDFLKVADEQDDVHFVVIHSPDLFSAYDIDKDSVIMLRTFDEERVALVGELTEPSITEFVDVYRLPYVVEFDPILAPAVLDNHISKHLLYFVSKEDERFTERIAAFREAAIKFKGKVIFVYVDVNNPDYQRIMNWFFVKKEESPSTRLLNLEGPKGTLKYRPDTEDWTTDELSRFVQEVLDGKRKVYRASEDLPDDWDSKPVKVLVGKNFRDIVKDPNKSAFVMFYAPWCGFCKELDPKWEAMAERFKDDPDIIIAKIDGTSNEMEGIKITLFPTMKFFPKYSDEEIEFQNIQTTAEKLIAFVENGGKLPEGFEPKPGEKFGVKKDEL